MGACLSTPNGSAKPIPVTREIVEKAVYTDGSESPGDTIRAGSVYFKVKTESDAASAAVGSAPTPPMRASSDLFAFTEGEIAMITHGGRKVDNGIESRLGKGPMKGSVFCSRGRKGVNQDSCLLWGSFTPPERKGAGSPILGAVFDGHGGNGHIASGVVRDAVPILLARERAAVDAGDAKGGDNGLGGWDATIKSAFAKVDGTIVESCKDVKVRPPAGTPDLRWSGSTGVMAIVEGRHVILVNLGDSRAIVVTEEDGAEGGCNVMLATEDHKPNDPVEKKRAESFGACCRSIPDEPHRTRLWPPDVGDALAGKCALSAPGVAMSRAFGDGILKNHGLSSEPTICTIHLDPSKRHLILLGSDGIWDVDSCDAYGRTAFALYDAAGDVNVAQAVQQHAIKQWNTKYPNATLDDIGVVCIMVDREGATSDSCLSPAVAGAGDVDVSM
mmetsp:Transcript_28754/g.91777  ORF Transcript_28754/g.91777 Transcript_28754/m.91777 type:complete len:444 (+) Transcript_28754:228-1559(+)